MYRCTTQKKTRNFQKYVTDEYITVNTEQRLYLFDLANKTFTVELRTEDAASATLPFGTWESATTFPRPNTSSGCRRPSTKGIPMP